MFFMEAIADPKSSGPDWMPITPKKGSLFHAESQREAAEKLSDGRGDGVEVPRGGFAQQVFQLGEDLLDGVQIGRVFRQEEELGAGRADGMANGAALVAAEIVEDDECRPVSRSGREPSRCRDGISRR